MELSCPSCSKRFRVADHLIGEKGRKVKCSSCSHLWWQMPEESLQEQLAPGESALAQMTDEAVKQPDEVAQAVAEAVEQEEQVESDTAAAGLGAAATGMDPQRQPRADWEDVVKRSSPDAKRKKKERAERPEGGRSFGLLLGWLFFFIVIGGLVFGAVHFRQQIEARYPQTAELYSKVEGLLAIAPASPLSGLELQEVTSVRRSNEGKRFLIVEGKVHNKSNEEIEVPKMIAKVIGTDGSELLSWTFDVDDPVLPAGAVTSFSTETENPPSEGSLLLDFAPEEAATSQSQ